MARSFNGTSDLINVSMPAGDTSGVINVGCWINGSDTSGALISSDTGSGANRVLQLKVTSSVINFILFFGGAPTAISLLGSVNVADSKPHHIVGSYDGSTMRIYVDGVQDKSVASNANHTFASKSLRIGAHLAGVTQSFYGGIISDAFIRYSGIAAGEALSLAAGLPASHLAPDHYWPLWGRDSPEPDIGVGTHVTGTLTGTSFASGGKVGKELLVL